MSLGTSPPVASTHAPIPPRTNTFNALYAGSAGIAGVGTVLSTSALTSALTGSRPTGSPIEQPKDKALYPSRVIMTSLSFFLTAPTPILI